MELVLDEVSREERHALSVERASVWREPLTVEQFVARNERLYAHEFGKTRIQTICVRNPQGRILSSMDVLQIPLLAKVNGKLPAPKSGVLIASVITPKESRKKGYASTLLRLFFEANPDLAAVLYSDIEPKFYEKLGFALNPMKQVEAGPREVPTQPKGEPISLLEFGKRLREARKQLLEEAPQLSAAVVFPDDLFLDFHNERYRYFASLSGDKLSDPLFWRLVHGGNNHYLAAIPDRFSGRLDGFWLAPGCGHCRDFLFGYLRSSWGLLTVRYWTPAQSGVEGKEERPMVRLPDSLSSVKFVDPQFCDWW